MGLYSNVLLCLFALAHRMCISMEGGGIPPAALLADKTVLMRHWTHLTCVFIVLDSLARPVFQGWEERVSELFYLLCPCVKINELISA